MKKYNHLRIVLPHLRITQDCLDGLLQKIEGITFSEEFPDILTYNSSLVFDSFLHVSSYMKDGLESIKFDKIDVETYLCYKKLKDSYMDLNSKLFFFFCKINDNTDENKFTGFDHRLDRISNLLSEDDVLGITPDKYVDVTKQLSNLHNKLFNQDFNFFHGISNSIICLMKTKPKQYEVKLLVSSFRYFIEEENEKVLKTVMSQVRKFKSNRFEQLTTEHWAKLADLEDEVIRKVINGKGIDEGAFIDYFSHKELKELQDNKDVLEFIVRTTDAEQLYDLKSAYYDYYLFKNINDSNVHFFFYMLHRQNLIKCQLYDHLKEEYENFISGKNMKNMEKDQDNQDADDSDDVKKLVDEIVNKTKILLTKMTLSEVQYEKLWTKICSEEWAIKELSKHEPRTQQWGNIKFVACVLCLLQNTLVDPRNKTGRKILDANAYEIGRALGNEKYRAYVTQEYLSKERRNQIKVFLPYIV